MAFVLDASITISWAMEDEDDPVATMALERLSLEQAMAPSLWWFEVRNTLLVNEKRGRITRDAVGEFLRRLALLDILLDHDPVEPAVLRLARTHGLTAYDAAYLELAGRLTLPLATLDKPLIQAARNEGVPLVSA